MPGRSFTVHFSDAHFNTAFEFLLPMKMSTALTLLQVMTGHILLKQP